MFASETPVTPDGYPSTFLPSDCLDIDSLAYSSLFHEFAHLSSPSIAPENTISQQHDYHTPFDVPFLFDSTPRENAADPPIPVSYTIKLSELTALTRQIFSRPLADISEILKDQQEPINQTQKTLKPPCE